MKKSVIRSSIVIFALLSTLAPDSSAQVTIGSGIEPNKGALLDLKENIGDSRNITANKGILLPRVKLTDPDNLYPMFTPDGKGGYKEGTKTEEDRAHIGLTVYNVDRCSVNGTGLYIWDGTGWKKTKEELPSYVYSVVDSRDGDTYLARNFGALAGDWMLENMRYLDSDISLSRATDANLPDILKSRIRRYFYPNGKNEAPPVTWRKEQGLLYTYSAATKGKQDNIHSDQGQIAGDKPGASEVESTIGYIQGVCPSGWHIPSDREWNALEKEIYNNPQKYSSYTGNNIFSPVRWDAAWESGSLSNKISRGSSNANGHGYAMLSACTLPNQVTGSNGKSFLAELGGFEALPVGYVSATSIIDYGEGCFFWTASSSANNSQNANLYWALDRIILSGNHNIRRLSYSRDAMFSVRCKKD